MSDPTRPGGPLQDPVPDETPTVSSHIENASEAAAPAPPPDVEATAPMAAAQAQYEPVVAPTPVQNAAGGGAPPRRRYLAVIAAGAFLVAGLFGGVAIGHAVWPSHARVQAPQHLQPFGGSGQAGGFPFGQEGGSAPGFSEPGSGAAPNGSAPNGSAPSTAAPGSPTSSEVSSIAAKVSPSLVNINVKVGYGAGEGAATGIVLTPSGIVLTNNHVIDGATSISATDVGNGKTYSATVVGYDRSHDIAVIQLNGASGLTTAQFGDSTKLTVGQPVVAVGNAGGAGGTPSAAGGAVTAVDQHIVAGGGGSSEPLDGLVETNAAVQPGDSGGPLVDTSGKVIGIDTAASSRYSFRSSEGQGFAVPANTALAIATQIQNHQESATVHIGETAFLGVEMMPSGAQPGSSSGSGATLAGVLAGSPAARAGLKAGDVIVSVDGQQVGSAAALRTSLSSHHPGDKVVIGWEDQSGARHTATVTLTSGPAA